MGAPKEALSTGIFRNNSYEKEKGETPQKAGMAAF